MHLALGRPGGRDRKAVQHTLSPRVRARRLTQQCGLIAQYYLPRSTQDGLARSSCPAFEALDVWRSRCYTKCEEATMNAFWVYIWTVRKHGLAARFEATREPPVHTHKQSSSIAHHAFICMSRRSPWSLPLLRLSPRFPCGQRNLHVGRVSLATCSQNVTLLMTPSQCPG